jgi:hypothetical protein
MQDAPSCVSSPLVRANYLSPVDPKTDSLLSELTRDEKLRMLNGGERITPEYWTIDFDATGASKIGLKDMPMRDGPRGVHSLQGEETTTFAVAEARAAAFDVGLEYRVGAVMAAETARSSFRLTISPSKPTASSVRSPSAPCSGTEASKRTPHMQATRTTTSTHTKASTTCAGASWWGPRFSIASAPRQIGSLPPAASSWLGCASRRQQSGPRVEHPLDR